MYLRIRSSFKSAGVVLIGMNTNTTEALYILLWSAVIIGVAVATLFPYSNGSSGAPIITSGVNLYGCKFQQPAPMGIADYGITAYGQTYGYITSSFVGTANITSLHTNYYGDSNMSIQLNANLAFNATNGTLDYWGQNVAYINTATDTLNIIDNVWNSSEYNGSINKSAISGSGYVGTDRKNSTYYFFEYNFSQNPNGIPLAYPTTVRLAINSSINDAGEPQMAFSYDLGKGWVEYDKVTFKTASLIRYAGLEVNGAEYTPGSTFYDAEMILGGGEAA
jgi:Thermopsin.